MRTGNNVVSRMRKLLAKLLIVCMLVVNPCAAYGAVEQATAVSVKVLRSDGTVGLKNAAGREMSLVEGMRLYDGYRVVTQEASYAYMALDDTRLATLDAVSDMEIQRKGDDLALMLHGGNMFFDVQAKLNEEQTMNIHTSNVSLGIRGTSGLVEIVNARHTRVWLFCGEVSGVVTNPLTNQKKSITMTPGMVADFHVYPADHSGDTCDIFVRGYQTDEVPGFVLREMKKNPDLVERIQQSGGGDFSSYLEQADERLRADEVAMGELLARLQAEHQQQPHENHTVPAFPGGVVQEDNGTSGDSSEPSAPSNPADSLNPSAPSDTADPTDPSDEVASTDPSDEADPSDETDPADPDEPVVYETATLLSGAELNQKFQELLNNADSQSLTWNPFSSLFSFRAYAGVSDLTAIRYASEAPGESVYTVTLEASGSPVYAWYEAGTIWLYSDAPAIQMAADSSGLLNGFYSLTDISGLETFDTANVTNLSNAFSTLQSLTDFSPISGWDVSGVTDLSYAFSGCTSMADLSDLSAWDVGQVTDLSYTFAGDTALSSVDGISDWDTSSVTALDSIFSGCTNLLSAASLSTHDTGSHTAWDVKPTFQNAVKAEQFVNTGVAADTSYSGYPDWFMKTYRFIGDDGSTVIFSASIPLDAADLDAALKTQLDACAPEYLKNWNTSEDGSGAVLGAEDDGGLIVEDTSFYYQPLEATLVAGSALKAAISTDAEMIWWSDTPPGDDIDEYDIRIISEEGSDRDVVCWYQREASGGVVYIYGPVKTVYLNPDSSNAFEGFSRLTDISGLAKLDCSKVEDLSYAFHSDWNLEDLSPLSGWNTEHVTSLEGTFSEMGAWIGGMSDVSALADWNTGSVISMEYTFSDHNLKDISALQKWDTHNVQSFSGTFATSGSRGNTFDSVDALAGWDTGSATTMRSMFSGCDSLQNVEGLANWDVSNVTDMSTMFGDCKSLVSTDGLQNWDTSSVQNMTRMFQLCYKLDDLTALMNWDVGAVTEMRQMFMENQILKSLEPLSAWNPKSCTDFYMMFDYCDAVSDATCLDTWELLYDAIVNWMFVSTTNYPWWYNNGTLLLAETSTLTLDASPGTVEFADIAAASAVTFYEDVPQLSASNPDPDILGEEYITDAVELPAAEHETAVFDAWNTSADGSGVTYEAGEIVSLDGDLTLYALWTTPDAATPSNATPSDAATPPNAAVIDTLEADDATPSLAEPDITTTAVTAEPDTGTFAVPEPDTETAEPAKAIEAETPAEGKQKASDE